MLDGIVKGPSSSDYHVQTAILPQGNCAVNPGPVIGFFLGRILKKILRPVIGWILIQITEDAGDMLGLPVGPDKKVVNKADHILRLFPPGLPPLLPGRP